MSSPQAGLAELLATVPVIPVLTLDNLDTVVPLARALCRGGLIVLEVTLRTPNALEAIRKIAAEVPEAIVGAGTILDVAQIRAVRAAGARFMVSPGTTAALLDAAEAGPPLLPGVATVTEAMALRARGYTMMKFFPAEPSGGAPALAAWAAPLAGLRFCPTGGIDRAKAPPYLALPNVFAVGGSWVVPGNALREREWSRIEQLAREASTLKTERT